MSDFKPLIYKTTDGVYKEYGDNFLDGMFRFPKNTTDVLQWGDVEWGWMLDSFRQNELITSFSAKDKPNLSNCSSMIGVFSEATNFNGNINNWDVSNIKTMKGVFDGATSFNQPLNNWDVSNVTDMNNMFVFAEVFNQDISNWDVSNVCVMTFMFAGAAAFNQDISNWDVSNVENMEGMFCGAISFNQDISNWDVSELQCKDYMLDFAYSFNHDTNIPKNFYMGEDDLSEIEKNRNLNVRNYIGQYILKEIFRGKFIDKKDKFARTKFNELMKDLTEVLQS